jgi:hypothetical protein
MEYNISKIDIIGKRKLYDSKGNIKTIYGCDKNNKNHDRILILFFNHIIQDSFGVKEILYSSDKSIFIYDSLT